MPNTNMKKLFPVALGILFGLPIFLWVGSLLVNADIAFQIAVEKWLVNFSFENFFAAMFGWIDWFSAFLYGFFWCWFYGLFYGAYQRKYNTNSLKTNEIYDVFRKNTDFSK